MRKWKPSPARRRERCNSICATRGCASWSGRNWRGGLTAVLLRAPGYRSSRIRSGRRGRRLGALHPAPRRSSVPDPGARRRSMLAPTVRRLPRRGRGSSRTAEMPSGAPPRRRDAIHPKRARPGSSSAGADRLRRIPFSRRARCRRCASYRAGPERPIFALPRRSILSSTPRMQFRRRCPRSRTGDGRRDPST